MRSSNSDFWLQIQCTNVFLDINSVCEGVEAAFSLFGGRSLAFSECGLRDKCVHSDRETGNKHTQQETYCY